MRISDSIPPPTRDSAPTCLMATLKATLLALCLVGTLFRSPAAAVPTEIEITSGGTSRPINGNMSAFLNLFGDQFSLAVGLLMPGGFFSPGGPYIGGTTIAILARGSGTDTPGSFTYLGQTMHLGNIGDHNQLNIDSLSNPFVVPLQNDSPIANVPFTLTGGIFQPPPQGEVLHLHGTGNMTFTFTGPVDGRFGPEWGGAAQFVVVSTPEPSVIVLVATALGGLGVCAWRRLRFRRSSATGT